MGPGIEDLSSGPVGCKVGFARNRLGRRSPLLPAKLARATIGSRFEFQDPSDAMVRMKALPAAAAASWDGLDPIRQLDLADLQ